MKNKLTKLVNGVRIELTEKEVVARKAEELAWKKKHEATAYIRKRQAEYPSIPDQLDTIYHHGLDVWKAEIKKIKDKHPKPTKE